MEDVSTDRGGGVGRRCVVQAVMRAMGSRRSLARLPLTTCCAARSLTGSRPVPVRGGGLGTPEVGNCFPISLMRNKLSHTAKLVEPGFILKPSECRAQTINYYAMLPPSKILDFINC